MTFETGDNEACTAQWRQPIRWHRHRSLVCGRIRCALIEPLVNGQPVQQEQKNNWSFVLFHHIVGIYFMFPDQFKLLQTIWYGREIVTMYSTLWCVHVSKWILCLHTLKARPFDTISVRSVQECPPWPMYSSTFHNNSRMLFLFWTSAHIDWNTRILYLVTISQHVLMKGRVVSRP